LSPEGEGHARAKGRSDAGAARWSARHRHGEQAEDVEWWQPPDLPQSAFVENNYLTADFDSLAGVFDAGSINNNRQMNETVGGMKHPRRLDQPAGVLRFGSMG